MGSEGLCLHLDDIARDLSNPFLEIKLRQTSDRLMLSDPVTLVTFCEDDSLPYLLWSEFSVHKTALCNGKKCHPEQFSRRIN
jgi:hypothetical protein